MTTSHKPGTTPINNLISSLIFADERDIDLNGVLQFNTRIHKESLLKDYSAVSFEVDSRCYEIQNQDGLLVLLDFTGVNLGDEGTRLDPEEITSLSNRVLGIINGEVAGGGR